MIDHNVVVSVTTTRTPSIKTCRYKKCYQALPGWTVNLFALLQVAETPPRTFSLGAGEYAAIPGDPLL